MSISKAGTTLAKLLSTLFTGLLLALTTQNANAALSNCDAFSSEPCFTRTFVKKKHFYKRSFRKRSRHRKRTSHSHKRYRSNHRLVLPHVKTFCFPKKLRNLMNQVERHYGKKLILTSGYRSPRYNRKVGGAKRSQHMHCKAVDFKIPGVNKYSLAAYVKTLPSAGGVGSYCGSSSIHMDIGAKRSWHWGCGKHKKRKRFVRNRKTHKRHYRKSRRSYRSASYRPARKRHAQNWINFQIM